MKKTYKLPDRRKRVEEERQKESQRLVEVYVEGESNINYEKLELDDIWILATKDGQPVKEKEDAIGKPLPLIPKEQYLKNKLAAFDDNQPKFPQGKYQDPNEIYVKYQQKYVEVLRSASPHIFEELRDLTPYFIKLFGNQGEKYFDVVDDLSRDLARLAIDFPEYHPLNNKYYWGETKFLLSTVEFFYNFVSSNEKNVLPPAELEEAFNKVAYGKEIFVNILRNKVEEFIRRLNERLAKHALQPVDSLQSFLYLQKSLLFWADKYHLQKDWLILYAYYFLYQFSQNEHLSVNELQIHPRNFSRTQSYAFEFNYPGWAIAHQEIEKYEEELREKFESSISNYLSSIYSFLKLDKKTKFRKPKDLDNLKWLIAWNEEFTMPQIAECFNKSTSTIDSRIDDLSVTYDLPKRAGQKGRKGKTSLGNNEQRLEKIKQIKIDENF